MTLPTICTYEGKNRRYTMIIRLSNVTDYHSYKFAKAVKALYKQSMMEYNGTDYLSYNLAKGMIATMIALYKHRKDNIQGLLYTIYH